MKKEPIQINAFHIGVGITAVIFVILLIITLIQIFRPNPYGPGLRIDNLSDHVSDLSSDRKKSMFAALYRIVQSNLSDDASVPKSGAIIREGTADIVYNEITDVHSGSFIVDIEEIRQSYKIQYEWSSNETNPNLSGYPMLASCLDQHLVIYKEFKCKDMFSADNLNPYDAMSLRLPHHGETPSGVAVYLQLRKYLSGERYLEVNVNSCGNQGVLEQAKQYAMDWVQLFGLDAEKDVIFEVRDLCDGDY